MIISYDENSKSIVSCTYINSTEALSKEFIDGMKVDLLAGQKEFRIYDHELIQKIIKANKTNGTVKLLEDEYGKIIGVEAIEGIWEEGI